MSSVYGATRDIVNALHLPVIVIPAASITTTAPTFVVGHGFIVYPVVEAHYDNQTNQDIYISFDQGQTAGIFVPSLSERVYRYKSGRTILAGQTQIYVAAVTTAPSSGALYISLLAVQ